MPKIDPTGWKHGPLPVDLGTGFTPEWRVQHLRPEVRTILVDDHIRRHRTNTGSGAAHKGIRLAAVETIYLDEASLGVSLGIFHWASDATDSATLVEHVRQVGGRLGAASRSAVSNAMVSSLRQESSPWAEGDELERVTTVAIATSLESRESMDLTKVASQLAGGASTVDDPSQGAAAIEGVLEIPHRRVQVMRDGVAFLQTSAGPTYHARSSRSIGVDVVALAVLQREGLRRVAVGLDAVEDPVEARSELPETERALRRFRHRLWWREISTWHWPNRLLRVTQEQFALVEEIQLVRDEIVDLAQQAATESAQLTNALLAVVAILSLPGVAGTISPAVGASHLQTAIAVGAMLVIGVLLALSTLGRTLRAPLGRILKRARGRRWA
ncbi:MAG: hypothetical protein WKF72_09740 [Nocardioidaceae bacterium]